MKRWVWLAREINATANSNWCHWYYTIYRQIWLPGITYTMIMTPCMWCHWYCRIWPHGDLDTAKKSDYVVTLITQNLAPRIESDTAVSMKPPSLTPCSITDITAYQVLTVQLTDRYCKACLTVSLNPQNMTPCLSATMVKNWHSALNWHHQQRTRPFIKLPTDGSSHR